MISYYLAVLLLGGIEATAYDPETDTLCAGAYVCASSELADGHLVRGEHCAFAYTDACRVNLATACIYVAESEECQ